MAVDAPNWAWPLALIGRSVAGGRHRLWQRVGSGETQMDSKRSFGRFFGWSRSQPADDEPDAADVGTAFGMELSLQADEPPPEAPEPRQASGAGAPGLKAKGR